MYTFLKISVKMAFYCQVLVQIKTCISNAKYFIAIEKNVEVKKTNAFYLPNFIKIKVFDKKKDSQFSFKFC